MPPLPSDLRRVLENAVIAARDEATTAAGAALKRLAVDAKDFPPYLTPDERSLRLKLRAAARQLGDPWSADKQAFASLNKLTHEVAYEHWHRMLFARFLAENNLLIHPEHNVPVDLATVAELAQEEAAKTNVKADTWATAGRYAAAMLPQIFRPDDPALAVQLAPEHQQALEKILESLPPSTFTADDSLGWVYQFWQSAEKERVNAGVKGGDKITGETLPAVTQLFTEHYMVLFLLHNTIGAWHAGKVLATAAGQKKAAACATEQELRDLVALPGYSFEYLRFVPDEASPAKWRPAAGAFTGWPRAAKELKVLDPCCGSGHFLVAVLELLVRLRMAEEGLDAKAAALAVIADNLFGLELDARCTQIAAFNVAMAAWKIAAEGGEHFAIPELHIACAGLGPSASLEQWMKLADKNSKAWEGIPSHARQAVTNGLTNLHQLFSQAPELGSLIDPAQLGAGGELFSADWETMQPFLKAALAQEKDADAHERAIAAQGMAKAAEVLSGEYTLVITNVPYLGRGGQGDVLKAFAEKQYPEAKADLATVFVQRMLKWVGGVGHDANAGTIAAVTPQNWLFLTSYKKLRERLLKERTWDMVARLGPGAFETIGGHVVNVALLTISGGKPVKERPHIMAGIDVAICRMPAEKASLLKGEHSLTAQRAASSSPSSAAPAGDAEAAEMENGPDVDPSAVAAEKGAEAPTSDGSVKLVPQAEQLKNPGVAITLDATAAHLPRLGTYADCYHGITTTDYSRFGRVFWEVVASDIGERWVGQQSTVESTRDFGGCSNLMLWENNGAEVQQMRRAGATVVITGLEAWGRDGVVISQMNSLSVARYGGSAFDTNVAIVVPKKAELLPAIWAFLADHSFAPTVRRFNQKVVVEYVYFPTMPFELAHWQKVAAEKYPNGLPEPQSDDPTQWLFHGHPTGRVPLTADPSPHLATVLQVAVARLVGYKWPAELDTKMRLAPEARTWVEKCKDLGSHVDDDGVVPLVNINKERPGHERVRALLEAAFGPKWTPGLLNDLLAAADAAGKSLDEWLRGGDFWAQHCAVFHHRPFVWQIWDGKKDGFNILVHYHRLAAPNGNGKKLLEKIVYTYLGDWITQQQAAAKRGEAGADLRLKAAQDLQTKLEAIIAGEPPYDIFVRWKPLHEQPIGWNPDINDGVRVNIRPFVTAGVLRGKVNVKWTKDRGKEPESIRPKKDFPWFWSCPEDEPPVDFAGGANFTGERLNDLHYTNTVKQAARNRTEHDAAISSGRK
jgi:hypothetical protein